MKKSHFFASAIAASAFSAGVVAQELKLPKEVTPQLRAACETDVRRLCTVSNPTIAKVKSCVRRNFSKLGLHCQMKLASAGFSR